MAAAKQALLRQSPVLWGQERLTPLSKTINKPSKLFSFIREGCLEKLNKATTEISISLHLTHFEVIKSKVCLVYY